MENDMKKVFCLFISVFFYLGIWSELKAQNQNDRKATNTAPVNVTDIWIVVKTHFDLGYTDLAENVFHRYRTEMMDNALQIIDENKTQPEEKRFVWTIPGWPLEAQILGPKQDPIRKARIEKAVREAAIVPHALAFTTHTGSLDLEDLVRGLGFSSSVSREYGRPLPIAAKMTDVPSHSWVLPTLLSHAGIKFLHIGVNSASQYPRVPPLFWWEGPDGSRILCAYNINYGSTLEPPVDWPCKNYLAMMMTGDNQGPPNPEEVGKWCDFYQIKMPQVHVHLGTLDDFTRAVLTENPELPTIRGDMPDTWVHGLMSNPEATKTARNIRPLEPALETLDTELRNWGIATDDVSKPLSKAYEQSLLYGEHTWGMNAEYGPRRLFGAEWEQWMAEMEQEPLPKDGDYSKLPKGSKRKWMQSYQDHRDYANTAAKIVNSELDSRLKLLVSSVKTKGKGIVVYNALPWKRSGLVEVEGRNIFVEDVPANGYKTIPYKTESLIVQKGKEIETKYFKATFDLEKGGISSLVDKVSGKEMVDQSAPYVIGQFLHERFSSNEVYDRFFYKYSRIQEGWGINDFGKPGMPDASKVPYQAVTPSGWKMNVSETDAELCVTLKATDCKGLAKGYSLTYCFPKDLPYLEICWTVDEKTPEKLPEGGWLCFPFNILNPLFTVGRLGSPINPATDIIPGTNRHLLAVNTGTAITGSGTGIGLCSMDSPLQSLGEPGLWRWSMDYVPEIPTIFVNLYNNMWNTNFPLWQDGSWSERVRIWPLEKGVNTVENLTVCSWEARIPLMAKIADNPNGKLPSAQTGVTVSRKGVLITAFGHNPDGDGTVLRLWEQTGISGKVSIILPEGNNYKTALPVNLRGEPDGNPVSIHKNHFVVDLKGYAPGSFILKDESIQKSWGDNS
jgi:hypothetical protein